MPVAAVVPVLLLPGAYTGTIEGTINVDTINTTARSSCAKYTINSQYHQDSQHNQDSWVPKGVSQLSNNHPRLDEKKIKRSHTRAPSPSCPTSGSRLLSEIICWKAFIFCIIHLVLVYPLSWAKKQVSRGVSLVFFRVSSPHHRIYVKLVHGDKKQAPIGRKVSARITRQAWLSKNARCTAAYS